MCIYNISMYSIRYKYYDDVIRKTDIKLSASAEQISNLPEIWAGNFLLIFLTITSNRWVIK